MSQGAQARRDPQHAREAVLSKAVARATAHMGLTNAELAEIVGLSEASVSRLFNGGYKLKEHTKSFELAQLYIRVFRGLDAITGSDDASTKSWVRSNNTVLGGRPVDLMKKIVGLSTVVSYVDSQRALT
jgi:hypothetical protein